MTGDAEAGGPHSVAGGQADRPQLSRDIEIVNKKGLHARASAKFVQTVERFDAVVTVTRGGETVGGTSIMGLMMLSAGTGTTIHITAAGPQAGEAMDALVELVSGKFGEDE
jgi:phosphocarrier protein HPr